MSRCPSISCTTLGCTPRVSNRLAAVLRRSRNRTSPSAAGQLTDLYRAGAVGWQPRLFAFLCGLPDILGDVVQDQVVYVPRLVGATELDLVTVTTQGADEDLAGAEVVAEHALVAEDTDIGNAVEGHGDHRDLLADVGLVLDDDALVGDGEEARAGTFAVIDR